MKTLLWIILILGVLLGVAGYYMGKPSETPDQLIPKIRLAEEDFPIVPPNGAKPIPIPPIIDPKEEERAQKRTRAVKIFDYFWSHRLKNAHIWDWLKEQGFDVFKDGAEFEKELGKKPEVIQSQERIRRILVGKMMTEDGFADKFEAKLSEMFER